VSDLIADVVGDTYSGDLPLEPGTTMTSHLVGELRRRVDRSGRATNLPNFSAESANAA
jgi:hypothetical protein